MWLALVLLKRSDNLVEEYRTTSMVKHEVVPLEVAYQLLTDVKLHEGQKLVFSADLDRLSAQLRVGDKVLLETALAVKMRSKLMINERNTLKTLRLLAVKTTNIYFEFSRYLKEAKMVELGALLMVGCKNFLPSSFVVHNFLSKALTHNTRAAGSVRHFSTSSGNWKSHEDNDPLERKGTLLLIDIFKKIGDYLGAYVRLEQDKSCDQIYSELAWLVVRAGISDTPASKVNDASSSELYLVDHGIVLGSEYRNMVEHHSDHKLRPMSMFPNQAAPRLFSNQGTASTVSSRSLHTSALKVDAELIPSIPAKCLIDVLQRLHSPMHCVSIVAGLKRGLRRM